MTRQKALERGSRGKIYFSVYNSGQGIWRGMLVSHTVDSSPMSTTSMCGMYLSTWVSLIPQINWLNHKRGPLGLPSCGGRHSMELNELSSAAQAWRQKQAAAQQQVLFSMCMCLSFIG